VIDSNERLAKYKRTRMNLERVEGRQARLLQAMHNVDVNKSVDQESVTVMDKAFVFPTPRRLPFKTALAAVVGLTLGVGMVLFLEQRDQRVLSVAEARLNLPARLLGCVPEMASRKSRGPLELLTPDDRRHVFVESFRNLRASLRSLWPGRSGPRAVLITSALPDEGKSTVSANLSLALAFSGARVLLIDGDLRRGRLDQVLNLRAGPGLNELLGSSHAPDEFLQAAATPGLYFLPSGSASERAGELFDQRQFDLLLEMGRDRFDYVLIDSLPVLAAADARVVASRMDAILFVLRARFTSLPVARQALELLQEHHASLLGTVLNRVDPALEDYPFRYYARDASTTLRPVASLPGSGDAAG
jgi:capsular exopolysaccharide synthesis family protein